MNEFKEKFYDLCLAIGVVDQLILAGYLENESTINAKGAEQILKAIPREDPEWIEEYREMFSKKSTGRAGLMSDSISVTNKMKRFQIQFGYDKDLILKATAQYIKDSDPSYYQEADYFIFKRDGKKNEERSKLAAWCDLIINDEDKHSLFTKDG